MLERAGVALHYWDEGPKDATAVVLTHGATGDHGMFEFQVPALVGAGYRAVTWDVRGHGLSKPLGGAFTVAAAAQDLVALLDTLGLAKAVLVGQSMGGNIVQEVLFTAPERATAAVIVDSTRSTGPLSWRERALLAMSGPLMRAYPYNSMRKSIIKQSATTDHARADFARAAALVDRAEFFAIWGGTARCLHPEPEYRVGVPLLLVRGDADRLGNIARAMPRWAERDGARYEVIPSAGHLSQQDNPDAFNRVLLEFLGEQSAS